MVIRREAKLAKQLFQHEIRRRSWFVRAGGCQVRADLSVHVKRTAAQGNVPRRVGSKKVRLAGYRCV